jgi:hypothetical protein
MREHTMLPSLRIVCAWLYTRCNFRYTKPPMKSKSLFKVIQGLMKSRQVKLSNPKLLLTAMNANHPPPAILIVYIPAYIISHFRPLFPSQPASSFPFQLSIEGRSLPIHPATKMYESVTFLRISPQFITYHINILRPLINFLAAFIECHPPYIFIIILANRCRPVLART